MGTYSNIDAEGLQEMQRGALVLVDVRTDREVERGMIPGALHIPLHTLPSRLEEICSDGPLVIYCQSGVRSAQACAFVAQGGRDAVYNLAGGFANWAARGLPVAQT
ncbi:MAG TPA: rhodanese-like domain-containing protein [Burkholderiales bacterium]|nr:rhodanese-like domain-containing protein [Burkholderiales bacterium]